MFDSPMPLAVTAMIAVTALTTGCGVAPSSSAPAAAAAATASVSPTPTPTRTVTRDYETFSSVADLARASQVIVRGRVVGGPRKADEASQLGADRSKDEPSVVHRVDVEKVYKGTVGPSLFVIQPDRSRVHLMEKTTPLSAGRSVVLFLNDPGATFEGLSVHATYGNDQGHVSLTGSPSNPKPVGQHESVPLPATLKELEQEIAEAG